MDSSFLNSLGEPIFVDPNPIKTYFDPNFTVTRSFYKDGTSSYSYDNQLFILTGAIADYYTNNNFNNPDAKDGLFGVYSGLGRPTSSVYITALGYEAANFEGGIINNLGGEIGVTYFQKDGDRFDLVGKNAPNNNEDQVKNDYSYHTKDSVGQPRDGGRVVAEGYLQEFYKESGELQSIMFIPNDAVVRGRFEKYDRDNGEQGEITSGAPYLLTGGTLQVYLAAGGYERIGFPESSEYQYYNGFLNYQEFENINIAERLDKTLDIRDTNNVLFPILGYDGAGINPTFQNTFSRNGGLTILGNPTNLVHPWGNGYAQDFSDGAILKSNTNNDSYYLGGEFWDYYLDAGGALGSLDYPESDVTDDGFGNLVVDFNSNQRITKLDGELTLGGVVENQFLVGDYWVAHQQYDLGVPIELQRSISGTEYWLFDNEDLGIVSAVNTSEGVFPIWGGIRDYYLDTGGLDGVLGEPRSAEAGIGNGVVRQDFEEGYILWNGSSTGYNLDGSLLFPPVVDNPPPVIVDPPVVIDPPVNENPSVPVDPPITNPDIPEEDAFVIVNNSSNVLVYQKNDIYGKGSDYSYFNDGDESDDPNLDSGKIPAGGAGLLFLYEDRITPTLVVESELRQELAAAVALALPIYPRLTPLAQEFVDRLKRTDFNRLYVHQPDFPLSQAVSESGEANFVFNEIIGRVYFEIEKQILDGYIDINSLIAEFQIISNLTYSDVLNTQPLPALTALIGSTQGLDVYLKNFEVTSKVESVSGQNYVEYNGQIEFRIFDDFGVNEEDLYSPGLAAFYHLQHETEGYIPFVNEIIVEREISSPKDISTRLYIPDDFETVEYRDARPLSSDLKLSSLESNLSTKSNLSTANVHRFFQNEKGFHLYTSDMNEVAVVQEKSDAGELPYNHEGEVYKVLTDNKDTLTGDKFPGVKPIYRFFNTDTGAHLYTMDENEKNYVQTNLSNYNFEGISYYAFESEPEDIDTIPVYRMLNNSSGAHLFSTDQNELNYIEENLPYFSMENNGNAAYHVLEL